MIRPIGAGLAVGPYDKVELDRKYGTPVAVVLREEACRKPELWAKVDGTNTAKALREIMRAILLDVVPRLIEKEGSWR